jgi:cysteinyl-tRNA synthetase
MYPVKIHNSLTGRKEELVPLQAGKIGMYVCGITVYDYCHIGHGRMLVVFDMAVRYLRSLGYSVNYVRNITDIDDKIIRRAAENAEPVEALTARFIDAMNVDTESLGMLKPDHEPRATQYVPAIIRMVEQLVRKGYAYVADDGDVLYSVSSFPGYGKLSGKQLKDLRAGARVEVDAAKRDPLDFVLWKAAKPGEPKWDSPWGPGRPGWHIECSAMSTQVLGNHFDLHGGGVDLKFPHHENEIAQSCAALDTRFVNVWMHNGFVRINDEKMSKSLDNFFTIRDVVKAYPAEAVRYFLLATHYRAPINYSEENLLQAKAALDRLYTALRGVEASTAPVSGDALERFRAAMSDDFNTPEAFAVLQSLARDLNTAKAAGRSSDASTLAGQLRQLGAILGLLRSEPEQWFKHSIAAQAGALTDGEIDQLIRDRVAAREAKNWKESDRIRELLAAAGIVLEDGAKGTTWRRK